MRVCRVGEKYNCQIKMINRLKPYFVLAVCTMNHMCCISSHNLIEVRFVWLFQEYRHHRWYVPSDSKTLSHG